LSKFIENCLDTKSIIPSLDRSNIQVPKTLDRRDCVLPTENQGNTPMCVAYAATSWAEAINFKKSGSTTNLDPNKVYNYAKTIDGYTNQPGTTLDAALYALIHYNMVCASKMDVFLFDQIEDLKRALHKYDTALVSLKITSDWENHWNKLVMSTNSGYNLGGHAVIACGYNRSGVYIQNSWGEEWGKYGFALITWDVFTSQFKYGAGIKDVFDGMGF
jgi:C1A family cysteine protease